MDIINGLTFDQWLTKLLADANRRGTKQKVRQLPDGVLQDEIVLDRPLVPHDEDHRSRGGRHLFRLIEELPGLELDARLGGPARERGPESRPGGEQEERETGPGGHTPAAREGDERHGNLSARSPGG